MKFSSVDIGFSGLTPLEYIRLAKRADELGFGCLWLQEGRGSAWGAFALAGAILSNTEKIKVGTGIVSPFRRHPVVLAEEAAALSEISGDRFILGLGSGPVQLKTMGMKVSQLEGLKEAVEILRRLLKGERVLYSGKVFRITTPCALEVPPRVPPSIYVGALKPKMIELAAEIGDGLLISRRGGGSPRYVADVVKSVWQTIRGITKEFTIRTFIESSIDEDGDKARQTARRILASYTIPRAPRVVLEKAGLEREEVLAISQSKKLSEAAVSDGMIRKFSMSGTPKDCLEKLESFEGTGLDVPILYIHGPSPERALELAGKEILPQITG